MSWWDRLVGSAVGALSVGIVCGLSGIGPSSATVGLLAALAAALLGASADDVIAPSRPDAAGPPAARRRATPPEGSATRDVTSRATAQARSAGGAARAVAGGKIGTEDRATEASVPPVAAWEVVRTPVLTGPPERWADASTSDLLTRYLSRPDRRVDRACLDCGRTIADPGDDRPASCPYPRRTNPCDVSTTVTGLATRLRRGDDVSDP